MLIPIIHLDSSRSIITHTRHQITIRYPKKKKKSHIRLLDTKDRYNGTGSLAGARERSSMMYYEKKRKRMFLPYFCPVYRGHLAIALGLLGFIYVMCATFLLAGTFSLSRVCVLFIVERLLHFFHFFFLSSSFYTKR